MLSFQESVPLAPRTTLGVGGPAALFAELNNVQDAIEAFTHAEKRNLPLLILGGGSNVVVSDKGWPGLVLHMNILGVKQREEQGRVLFEAGAGEDWDGFVAQTVAADCGGLECLSGIPGSVGGTPVQNVGAYGQEVSDTIVRVTALDRHNLQVREFSNEECAFAYRTSVFNSTMRDRFVVLKVEFALPRGAPPKIEYADLKKAFANEPSPTLQRVRDTVRQIRQSKGMLLVDGDPDVRSAGSFFKNPIVSQAKFVELEAAMTARGLQLPSYPAEHGQRKLSAAWLVEKAGFHKGYVHGNVGISSKHTLAIINRGGAKASEVVSFMEIIRSTVNSRFGIELNPEPVFLGFDTAIR